MSQTTHRPARRSQSPRRQQPGLAGRPGPDAGPRPAGKQPHYSNAEVRLLFDGVAARIATIGSFIACWPACRSEGAIALGRHLREVCGTLVTAFSSAQQPVMIEHRGPDCLVLIRHVQPITLMVCEMLTNAMKYAHPAGVPLRLRVRCHTRTNGALAMIGRR